MTSLANKYTLVNRRRFRRHFCFSRLQATTENELVSKYFRAHRQIKISLIMRWSLSWLVVLTALLLLFGSSLGAITITARKSNHPKLKSIDESIVYKALTVIEGDILIDKYCECQLERECRVQKRAIIVLTKNQCEGQGKVCCEIDVQS